MFRFLRKYNKWILAVGGTLLMIVFLIPTAISGLSQRAASGTAAWATVGPERRENVTQSDLLQVQQELQLLQGLPQYAALPGIGVVDQPEHWFLLVREAEQAGVLRSTGSVYRDLGPTRDDTLRALAGTGSPEVALRVLTNIRGINGITGKEMPWLGTVSFRSDASSCLDAMMP